jgi:uroporphyrinogen III methyltransferase/synthase
VSPSSSRKTSRPAKPVGTVALVAAGPGDPELLTLRAVALLRQAHTVVVDSDVHEMVHAHVSIEATVIVAVGSDGVPLEPAARIKHVVEAYRAGRHVVRLISGDPVLDGTITAEITALRKAKVPFEIAPGVSNLSGISAYAGVTLMSRTSRSVQVLADVSAPVDWAALADDRTTVVVLDGAEEAPTIAKELIKAGRKPTTSMVITRSGTTVEQRSIEASLEDIPAAVKAAKQAGPGMVVIGDVVDQRDKMAWFEVKPLFGWRVLVPRTQERSDDLLDRLIRSGAVPQEVPTISVEPPRTPQQMERAVHGLVSGRYEWIGFTSVNAVRAVREKLEEYGLDARSFAGLKVAAVGEDAVEALIAFGVKPDLVAEGDQTTTALLAVWPPYDDLVDPINRVFLPRADIATETLAAGLVDLGWEVEDITAYRTVRAAPPPASTREAIKSGGFDAVLFTSSSTVRNLVGIAGKPHATTVVACIGPATAKTAEEHGLRVDVLCEEPTHAALAEALAEHGEQLRQAALAAGESTWRPSRKRAAARKRST